MRILMVAPQPFFRPRGTPFSVLHRIRALVRLGHEVELVTYPFGESPAIDGLFIHRTSRPPAVQDVPVGPSIAKLLLDAPLFVAAYRLARSGNFDLVHTHEEAGALGALIARRTGLPHLYDMHSSLPTQFANFGRFNWTPIVAAFEKLEEYILAGSDAVIGICPELCDRVTARGYTGPLELIENTLDFDPPEISQESVDELREQLDVTGARIILYTGTLEAYQGLDLLIAAAPRVLERCGDVKFVIVGGTLEQIARFQQLARKFVVASKFVFVPAVPPIQVFKYLRLGDVLVTTRSRGTNTPLKIYQYLRAGKPIVATAIRSHTQVLTPSSSELVEATPDGIAEGLVGVLTNPAYATRLAEGASRLAREEYSEDRYLERLRRVLAAISERAPRRAVGVA